jgi:hypothetical protein
MRLNVLGFEADGEWLREHLAEKHPLVLQAMERLGSDVITIKNFAVPRMLLTFGFKIDDLTEEEARGFDRQVDTDDASKVLDWQFVDFDPLQQAGGFEDYTLAEGGDDQF